MTEPVGEFAHLDVARRARTGVPEIVYGQGKTPEQTVRLLTALRAADPSAPALATRCPAETLAAIRTRLTAAPITADPISIDPISIDEVAGTVVVGPLPDAVGSVLVLTAGTADVPVAREAVITLGALGVGADLLPDVGVAGLHRLLERIATVRDADVLIVAAGMDGALPSVVAGLVDAPVIGLPTGAGYGVAAGGAAATTAMLASCSPGLVVVNTDNGVGAAAHAAKIVYRMHGV